MNEIDFFFEIEFESYDISVPRCLDAVDAAAIFENQPLIVLKPNLVNDSAFPVTTCVDLVRVVIDYIRNVSSSEIVIAEGCGDADLDTMQVFFNLGYTRLSSQYGIELIDLNTADLVERTHPENEIFPKMYLPELIMNHFVFSLPVLKAHSLAGITGTLKNMMGAAPPKYYSGGGFWKKAVFHHRMQQSIIELNRYRVPDLTLLDGSVGLADYHLGGPVCDPPVKKLIVAKDPYRLDRRAAELLGLKPPDHCIKQ